jgi:DNA polymerase-3 subunit alpha
MSFCHLHTHTEWSLLDGSNKVKEYVKRVKELGMTSAAITDHGVMYGVIDFYEECLAQGIKPVLGCEVYVAPGSRFDREAGAGDDRYYHLILLAENNKGYENLSKIVSHSFLEGYYYRPRVDMELLRQYHEGIIASSACLAGEIARDIVRGDIDAAKKTALKYNDCFGQGNFFLELQDHGYPDQKKVNTALLSISKELGIPLIATNDCHYTYAEDAEAHDILLCIQTGKKLSDENRMRYPGGQFYVKSEDEMRTIFAYAPEAIENTQKIADRCNVAIEFGKTKLPHYDVPEGYDSWTYLNMLCEKGMAERYPDDEKTGGKVRERLNYELGVIRTMGYVDYFLIVWDYINFAREHGIGVGPGRGSAAGSVVSYCLHITNLDPIKYDLIFERFLNPERVSMPDIDVDFAFERRQEVINYVTQKYGPDRVVQIITFGTLQAKGVIRDVGRVMDLPYSFCDSIARMVPNELGITLDKALKMNPDMRKSYETDDRVKKLIDMARRLEGLPRHTSVHAAGVVICSRPAEDLVPLSLAQDGSPTTQFTMTTIERLGLLKMDFLGLRTLTVIQNAVRFAEQSIARLKGKYTRELDDCAKSGPAAEKQGRNMMDSGNITQSSAAAEKTEAGNPSIPPQLLKYFHNYPGRDKIDIEHLTYDDAEVFASLQTGRTDGVFQLESAGMQNFMKELKPESFEDIIAGIALYRPGPMEFIPKYIAGKKNPDSVTYDTPELKPILESTYGCIVYQEQVMRIVRDLGGYSLGRSDLVRRAMSKKKAKVMEEERQNFIYGNEEQNIPGCIKNGIPEDKANHIYDTMIDFAKYAFNKSHAACYAVVTYETAWLKYYFPTEYMAALMTSVIDNPVKLTGYILTSRQMGIRLMPPDINEGESGFSVTYEGADGRPAIRYALNAVKGVGTNVIDAIVEERCRNGKFLDFQDFCARVTALSTDVNKRVIENLIKAGTFDSFGNTRKQLMSVYSRILDSLASSKKNDLEGQMSLFDFAPQEVRQQYAITMPDVGEYPKEMKLAFEKEVIGVYVSGHPLDDYIGLWNAHVTKHAADFILDDESGQTNVRDGETAVIGGLVTDCKIKYTKNDKVMAFVTLEDLTGSVEVIVFPRDYEVSQTSLSEENKVFIKGRVSAEEDKDAKLICQQVTPFDDVPRQLWIRFDTREQYLAAEKDILDLIDRHGGRDQVVIYIANPRMKKNFGAGYGIRMDAALMKGLKEQYGEKNVVYR